MTGKRFGVPAGRRGGEKIVFDTAIIPGALNELDDTL
jgi:hypothetical protein